MKRGFVSSNSPKKFPTRKTIRFTRYFTAHLSAHKRFWHLEFFPRTAEAKQPSRGHYYPPPPHHPPTPTIKDLRHRKKKPRTVFLKASNETFELLQSWRIDDEKCVCERARPRRVALQVLEILKDVFSLRKRAFFWGFYRLVKRERSQQVTKKLLCTRGYG